VIGDAICRCRVCLLVRLIGVAGEATLAANIDASRVCCCAVSSRQDGPHCTSEKCAGVDITRQPQQNALRIALALTVSPISKEHQVRANLQRAAIGFTRSGHDIINACRRNPVTSASPGANRSPSSNRASGWCRIHSAFSAALEACAAGVI
jgi:hypothetical protein